MEGIITDYDSLSEDEKKQLDEQFTYTQDYIIITRNNPQWISVKERLPENTEKDLNDMPLNFSTEVLVFGSEIPSVGFYDFELNKWLFSMDEEIENATHWMPLPSPPNK